jgi:predicted AAA+ superfamily ATPase
MIYQRILQPNGRSSFLFGPRGVGKSSWLRKEYPHAVFVDLLNEGLYQRYLANPEELTQTWNALPDASTIVIDEIQRLPQLLNEVHRFIENRAFQFILSGSSARKLRRAGTNLLAGRAVRREMFPLTPEELGADFNLEKALETGTLPIVWTQNGNVDVLDSYVQTYLREEIQAEALVRNLGGFARFISVAALFNSQVLNATALARDAGVSRTTVLGYLEILEDTLLAFRLPAWEGRLRVKEKTHPKLYWVDPGIARAARRRFGPVVDEERGSLFEGWIATLLRTYQSYRRAFDDWNYWAPTESDNLEVDFLLWKGDACLAIEVKTSKRWRSEFTQGLNALSGSWKSKISLRCMVVYLGESFMKTDEGIEVLPLAHFLRRLESNQLFQSQE